MTDMKRLRREVFEEWADAKQILEMFIEWANRVEEDEELKFKYDDFFSDQFDLTKVEADFTLPSGRYLFIQVGEGGEGGPSILVAHWDKLLADSEWELVDITHRFDLRGEIMWSNSRGGYVYQS